jgi:hypothetical protein
VFNGVPELVSVDEITHDLHMSSKIDKTMRLCMP